MKQPKLYIDSNNFWQPFTLVGVDGSELGVDAVTNALTIIDYAHHEIHEGSAYFVTYVVILGDGGEAEIMITTPNTTKWPHMLLSVAGTGETDFKLFETTTKTGGTPLTTINRNRNSVNTSGLAIAHTPSGSGDGTLIAESLFGVDAGGGNNRQLSGGGADVRDEIILKQNTKYLINVTSGTASNRITIVLDWYEHTNK